MGTGAARGVHHGALRRFKLKGLGHNRFVEARHHLARVLHVDTKKLTPLKNFIGNSADIEPLPTIGYYEHWLSANYVVKEIEDAS